MHTHTHVHTCSPASLLPSVSSGKRKWKEPGALAACGPLVLRRLGVGRGGGEAEEGDRAANADGTGLLCSAGHSCGLHERTLPLCAFVLLNCLGGINLVLNEKSQISPLIFHASC